MNNEPAACSLQVIVKRCMACAHPLSWRACGWIPLSQALTLVSSTSHSGSHPGPWQHCPCPHAIKATLATAYVPGVPEQPKVEDSMPRSRPMGRGQRSALASSQSRGKPRQPPRQSPPRRGSPQLLPWPWPWLLLLRVSLSLPDARLCSQPGPLCRCKRGLTGPLLATQVWINHQKYTGHAPWAPVDTVGTTAIVLVEGGSGLSVPVQPSNQANLTARHAMTAEKRQARSTHCRPV
jgi:hypothetical protein